MYHPSALIVPPSPVVAAPARQACLVPGCSCKDARIVSHRRAAFFAAIAKGRGETADRIVAVDPTWRLPSPTDIAGFERIVRSAP
jgi:hypothetical protein